MLKRLRLLCRREDLFKLGRELINPSALADVGFGAQYEL